MSCGVDWAWHASVERVRVLNCTRDVVVSTGGLSTRALDVTRSARCEARGVQLLILEVAILIKLWIHSWLGAG